MAGETSKTTARSNFDSAIKGDAKLHAGKLVEARDYHAFTTSQLEAADVLLTNISIPSNAIVSEILMYNDDLDSNACPTLALDFGLYARERFISTTSSSDTIHSKDSIVDADLFVDGATDGQAASTKFVSLALDSATMGPDDAYKEVWELLGYDEDPRTTFGLAVTAASAAATAAAGDAVFIVRYSVH